MQSTTRGIFRNMILNSTSGVGASMSSSHNNSFSNITTITTGSSTGFYIYSASGNNITNSNLTTGGAASIGYRVYTTNSFNNRISNSSITTYGINSNTVAFTSTSNNTIDGCTITANATGTIPLYLESIIDNNFTNNKINGLEASNVMAAASRNNLFRNNTFISTHASFIIPAPAYNNTFCLNNFTNPTNATSYYIQDYNGTNRYNCTYDGKNQGNIWANVINDSVHITGQNNSSILGLYIGTSLNYTNTTSLGKFQCNFAGCADYAPLTQNLGTVGEVISIGSYLIFAGVGLLYLGYAKRRKRKKGGRNGR
jgi:hypothetical protein